MNKKKYLLVFAFAVALAAGNMYVIKNNGCKVLLSLADLDSSANDPKEIDYFVPNKNNNPRTMHYIYRTGCWCCSTRRCNPYWWKKIRDTWNGKFLMKSPEKGEDPTVCPL